MGQFLASGNIPFRYLSDSVQCGKLQVPTTVFLIPLAVDDMTHPFERPTLRGCSLRGTMAFAKLDNEDATDGAELRRHALQAMLKRRANTKG